MADDLFHLVPPHATGRRFDRRQGLDPRDFRKSCGTRFLQNLETAIFSRAGDGSEGGPSEESETPSVAAVVGERNGG